MSYYEEINNSNKKLTAYKNKLKELEIRIKNEEKLLNTLIKAYAEWTNKVASSPCLYPKYDKFIVLQKSSNIFYPAKKVYDKFKKTHFIRIGKRGKQIIINCSLLDIIKNLPPSDYLQPLFYDIRIKKKEYWRKKGGTNLQLYDSKYSDIHRIYALKEDYEIYPINSIGLSDKEFEQLSKNLKTKDPVIKKMAQAVCKNLTEKKSSK